MFVKRLPDGKLLVPMRAVGPGVIGDGCTAIGPDHPEYAKWEPYADKVEAILRDLKDTLVAAMLQTAEQGDTVALKELGDMVDATSALLTNPRETAGIPLSAFGKVNALVREALAAQRGG